MSADPIRVLANLILALNATEMRRLRHLLEEGGDLAGVHAVIPPNLPLKEDGIAEDLPEDYWETAQ